MPEFSRDNNSYIATYQIIFNIQIYAQDCTCAIKITKCSTFEYNMAKALSGVLPFLGNSSITHLRYFPTRLLVKIPLNGIKY